MIGPNNKEYKVHGTAISRLSKPLGVLLNGDMREAKEKCVKWPEIDEKTFVRFTQWAYQKTYVTEEPDIGHDASMIPIITATPSKGKGPDKPLYSLAATNLGPIFEKDCCWNSKCASYGKRTLSSTYQATCLACRRAYNATRCSDCSSILTDCPTCGPLSSVSRTMCSKAGCGHRNRLGNVSTGQATCPRCRTDYSTKLCSCGSVFSDCGACAALLKEPRLPKRRDLISKFLDKSGIAYPTSGLVFSPRKNTEGCEDYTGVFLCHARLYVLADTYDIPSLKQLSLHRLHATLTEFTLYPSRMDDIATLAKYVFENTVTQDKIRDMVTLYYACIVEDARKQDGFKSLIQEIPEFALDLISKMSDRLA